MYWYARIVVVVAQPYNEIKRQIIFVPIVNDSLISHNKTVTFPVWSAVTLRYASYHMSHITRKSKRQNLSAQRIVQVSYTFQERAWEVLISLSTQKYIEKAVTFGVRARLRGTKILAVWFVSDVDHFTEVTFIVCGYFRSVKTVLWATTLLSYLAFISFSLTNEKKTIVPCAHG